MLTYSIIAGSLQPPEVAKTLVVARVTPAPTQQFLDAKVIVVVMNHKGSSKATKIQISVKHTQDRHSTASRRSQGYGSIIICELSWRDRSKT
jgi:hypothetical protein